MATANFLRYLLAGEFLLGGQVRVIPALTPQLHQYVMSKANHFYTHLSFMPGNDAKEKTQVTGLLMFIAAALLGIPSSYTTRAVRVASFLLGGFLSTILWIGEATIDGQAWVPAANVTLAAWLLYNEFEHSS